MARYWLRTIRGLEWIVASEVAELVNCPQIALGHRDVFFESDRPLDPASLRSSDDAFLFWTYLSNIDHTRDTLRRLSNAASELPPAPSAESKVLWVHVTASFLGQRNYSRGEIEHAFGASIASRLGLTWCEQMPEDLRTLRVRIHLAGERAAVGVGITPRPTHRRSWRVHTRKGMLHPPVAASMALLADLHEGFTVHDPFAGSGTILIEAGLRCPGLHLSGWDIDSDAVDIARDHAAKAGVSATLQVKDALGYCPSMPKPNRILSNPPWGRSVATKGPSTADPLEVLLSLLGPEGRLVAVADRSMEMASFWERKGYKPLVIFPIRISGRIADVGVVSPVRSGLSDNLGRYWKAMDRIAWEGEESEAILDVPVDWGRPVHIQ